MKKLRCAAFAAAICLLLSGCSSILDRQYGTVEEHSSKYWESESTDTLRAETYQDVVNDLLLLIGRHAESASLRLYNFEDESTVSDILEQAATEVQQETPLGAYAANYITTENRAQRGYYEASVHIGYRRSAAQVQNIVNATSVSALPDLLDAAFQQGKSDLAVRIGYWTAEDRASVEKMVEDVRSQRGLSETEPWTISYYPPQGNVGLIEFTLPASAENGEKSLKKG